MTPSTCYADSQVMAVLWQQVLLHIKLPLRSYQREQNHVRRRFTCSSQPPPPPHWQHVITCWPPLMAQGHATCPQPHTCSHLKVQGAGLCTRHQVAGDVDGVAGLSHVGELVVHDGQGAAWTEAQGNGSSPTERGTGSQGQVHHALMRSWCTLQACCVDRLWANSTQRHHIRCGVSCSTGFLVQDALCCTWCTYDGEGVRMQRPKAHELFPHPPILPDSLGISDRVRAGGNGDLLTRNHVVAAQHPRVALVIGLVL